MGELIYEEESYVVNPRQILYAVHLKSGTS